MKVAIDLAGRREWQAVQQLHAQSAGPFTVAFDEHVVHEMVDAGYVYCARTNHITGICFFKPASGLEDRGDGAWVIAGLYISPRARHRGVAQALVRGALFDGIERHHPPLVRAIIHRNNRSAAALFMKLGFVARGQFLRLEDSEAPENFARIDGLVIADAYELTRTAEYCLAATVTCEETGNLLGDSGYQ